MSASELRAVPFKGCDARMQTLEELCDLLAGRAPLLVEMKSHFDGDFRLVHRVVEVLSAYRGPAAAMSFDPAMVTELRRIAPNLARGIVAERHYHHAEWDRLSPGTKRSMGFLLHAPAIRPHFVAYSVKDLPSPAPLLARTFGLPLLTWTVRTEENRQVAARWADQLIFEGWRPL
jgi:glycerophosphoryl diester phosphodiesterase